MELYNVAEAIALVKVQANNTIPFRMINPSKEPVTIYRHSNLANLTTLPEDFEVSHSTLDHEKTEEETPDINIVEPPPPPPDSTDSSLEESQKEL